GGPRQGDPADDRAAAAREEARQQRHGRWHPYPFEGAVAVRGIPEGVDDAVPLADAHDRRNRETAEPQSVDDATRPGDPQAPGRQGRHEVSSSSPLLFAATANSMLSGIAMAPPAPGHQSAAGRQFLSAVTPHRRI